jgi:putative endonuclease
MRTDNPDTPTDLARRGEDLACTLLADAGLLVTDRNWRCGAGEIDIVARAPGLLVICEVKTRRGHAFGTPAAAVTDDKLRRLLRLAGAYLAAHPPGAPVTVRFDVVEVTWPRGHRPTAHHRAGVL